MGENLRSNKSLTRPTFEPKDAICCWEFQIISGRIHIEVNVNINIAFSIKYQSQLWPILGYFDPLPTSQKHQHIAPDWAGQGWILSSIGPIGPPEGQAARWGWKSIQARTSMKTRTPMKNNPWSKSSNWQLFTLFEGGAKIWKIILVPFARF